MALWPERFDKNVVAEIRGKVDKDEKSIFWKHFSRYFFDEDIFDNDQISYINNSFISVTFDVSQSDIKPYFALSPSDK